MPRKSGAQKRKAKEAIVQDGRVGEKSIRDDQDGELVKQLTTLQPDINWGVSDTERLIALKKIGSEAQSSKDGARLGECFDLAIALGFKGRLSVVNLEREVVELTEEVIRHAPTGDSPKEDVEMIAELEEEVKEKEKEIKRLGDGWADSEEMLTGLRNRMSWKKKEIGELKESAQKTKQEFEDFRAVAKAEAERVNKLGLSAMFRRIEESQGDKKKIEELQGEKEKMEQTIRDLEGSRRGTEEVVALQRKFEGVECALRCAQDELGVERTKRMELEAARKLLEDVEMGGTSLSPHSQETMVDAATNTEKRTYAQAAVQVQVGEKRVTFNLPALPGVSNDKGKKPEATSMEVASASGSVGGGSPRSHEDGIGGSASGAMTKAVVVHGISTNWKVSGVADCVEGIMGRVIGSRWLLGAGRRVGKMASSMVIYLDKEVFLGPKAYVRMAGVDYSVVPYRW